MCYAEQNIIRLDESSIEYARFYERISYIPFTEQEQRRAKVKHCVLCREHRAALIGLYVCVCVT